MRKIKVTNKQSHETVNIEGYFHQWITDTDCDLIAVVEKPDGSIDTYGAWGHTFQFMDRNEVTS